MATDLIERFFKMALNPKGISFSIISSLSNAMMITDANLIIRYANQRYLDLIGVSDNDIVGRKLEDVRPNTILSQVIQLGSVKTDLLSRTIPNAVVDMAVPLVYKGQVVGGISILKENHRIQQLYKEMEKYIHLNQVLAQELKDVVKNAYSAKYVFSDIVGYSLIFQNTVALAKKIAGFEADVLITGESGTGKELFAQAIHNASNRSNAPFVPVNCSTLNSSLVESELFGYDSDSFTGAQKGGKMGMFSVAEGGTILLDEIGEIPMEIQAKLLRVLQERAVRKVGGTREVPINVRVIASTNKNLLSMVKEGKFREDLYYRLNQMRVELPCIRDRKEDLKPLADSILVEWNKKNRKKLFFHPGVYDRLSRHDWPGNVRELKNAIHFAAFMCDTEVITNINLPEGIILPSVKTAAFDQEAHLKDIMEATERNIIREMLKKYGSSLEAKKGIAEKLGISLPTLYNKIRMFESARNL